MSTWRRHRAQRNSRASSIAPPGGEGWTIRDYRAILYSEPYASADLGAASDVTAKSVQSEAASASSPTPISHQLTSDIIAGTRGARVLWQAASAQGENHDTSQAGAVGRFSAGSLRPAQSVHEGCSPFIRAFSQPPTAKLPAIVTLQKIGPEEHFPSRRLRDIGYEIEALPWRCKSDPGVPILTHRDLGKQEVCVRQLPGAGSDESPFLTVRV